MTISALFLALVLSPPEASSGPVLLDFHADWCGPCRQMRPVIREVQRRGYAVRSIDVDEDRELASRYRVNELPTLVILGPDGREVLRRVGPQTAADLMRWLDAAGRPRREGTPETTASGGDRPARPSTRLVSSGEEAADSVEATPRVETPPVNPKPWETVVRITVQDNGSLGFGSGTVIKSTEQETIILTCAHIFQMRGRRKQVPPEEFPLPVLVELFDGVLGGPGGQTVRPVGRPYPAEVLDYDFTRDVGLIRIRPGRIVPAARVVPPAPYWEPRKNMSMYTVGCSHGNDATAWNTVITEPLIRGLADRPEYEAIQCLYSPKEGRSGGGLFTDDGYVAGVCNFAFSPRLSQGLYASPRSIHRLLQRNGLEELYLPGSAGSGTMVARAGRQRREEDVFARMQSPDEREDRSGGTLAIEPITVPPPDILGVEPPDGSGVSNSSSRRVAAVSGREGSAGGRAWTAREAQQMLEMDPPAPRGVVTDERDLEATDGDGFLPPRNGVGSVLEVAPDDRFEPAPRPGTSPSSVSRRWKPRPQPSSRSGG